MAYTRKDVTVEIDLERLTVTIRVTLSDSTTNGSVGFRINIDARGTHRISVPTVQSRKETTTATTVEIHVSTSGPADEEQVLAVATVRSAHSTENAERKSPVTSEMRGETALEAL